MIARDRRSLVSTRANSASITYCPATRGRPTPRAALLHAARTFGLGSGDVDLSHDRCWPCSWDGSFRLNIVYAIEGALEQRASCC